MQEGKPIDRLRIESISFTVVLLSQLSHYHSITVRFVPVTITTVA